MSKASVIRFAVVVLAAAATMTAPPAATAADVNMYDGDWHYDLTVYAWWAGINGTFILPLPADSIIGAGGSHSISVSPNDYLKDLQFGATLAGEARKGNAAIFTDLLYMDLASLTSKVKMLADRAARSPCRSMPTSTWACGPRCGRSGAATPSRGTESAPSIS